MTRTPSLSFEDAQAQAAAFIEARRAQFGGMDFRMEATDDGTDGTKPDGTKPDGTNDGSPEETPDQKAARLEAELTEWKSNARKHEDRAKANKAAAEELAALKAKDATDADKIAAAEKAAAEARAELARYKVAAETGVPADLLTGADEDAMRDTAKRLLAFRGEQKKTPPKPDPSQGTPGGDGKKPSARDAGKAEAERRFGPKK